MYEAFASLELKLGNFKEALHMCTQFVMSEYKFKIFQIIKNLISVNGTVFLFSTEKKNKLAAWYVVEYFISC